MIGSRIGQYRVLALLGEGGMGKVLLVEHAVIGTRHALKMLHDELSNNDMIVQRFLNEARAAGAIGHRNVVEISHVDQVEGRGPWYLVMKYLEGQTLSAFLAARTAPLDQRLIVHVIGEALNGLQAAHDRQIIHRDLKPDNLLLTAVKGDPYRTVLLDFGVAQLGHNAGLVTKTGAVIGTPQYMAPEQHRGAAVDHRSDLWAIGAIVYEMATGRFPYQDDGGPQAFLSGPEIFHRMMSRAVVDPRRFNPAITPGFAKAMLMALELEPGRRPSSARELALLLAEATPGSPEAPSGIEVLRSYADELLHGIAVPAPMRSSDRLPLALPTVHGELPHRELRGTVHLAPSAPMSTLGASASQVSAPMRRSRKLRGPITFGLCLAAITATAIVLVNPRGRRRVAVPTHAGVMSSVAPAADVRPDASEAASVVDAATLDAAIFDASRAAAAPPEIAAPVVIDAGISDASATAPPAVTSATGRLNVVVLPWAEVWIDGRSFGQAPVRAKLAVGAHRVRLKNDAHEKTITVTVTADKTSVIDETW